MANPVLTERQVQRHILKMCGVAFPSVLIHHSPNGAHLAGNGFMQMGALKGDGLKVGFPDLICLWADLLTGQVAFIEVKRPGKASALTPQQIDMHRQLKERGFPVAVITSAAEAFKFLKDCGAPTSVREYREAA